MKKLYIDGVWTEGTGLRTWAVTNPATGQHLEDVAVASAEDVDRAVCAARRAFDDGPWPRLDPLARGRMLQQLAVEIRARLEDFAMIDTLNVGKPIRDTRGFDVPCAADLFEVDIGMGRCGVQPGKPVLELVQRLNDLPGVRFAGLQAFEGHLVNVLDRAERVDRATAAMQLALDTRELLEAAGVPVGCVSGCSSATYDSTGVMAGIDEIQAGTYATMDRQYHQLVPEFEIALSVLVRVISRPAADKAVLDLGVKGAGGEFGVPAIRDFPDVEIPYFLSEEHLVVRNVPDWSIGHTLHLIPSHACTTCNLYREFVVHEHGRVVEIWPIEASGRLS